MQAVVEKVLLRENESFACREISVERFTAPWHVHPEYELTLIEHSSGTRLIGDSIEHFAAGDLVLVGGGLPHCWLNADSPPDQNARAIVAQFTPDCLGARFFDVPELRPVQSLLQRAARGLSFHGKVLRAVQRELRRLLVARTSTRVLGFLSVLGQLAEAREAVPLSSPSYKPVEPTHSAARLERVHRFLMSEYKREISLIEVAAVAHMTTEAFCRYFRRTSGRTLTQFLNELRIGHACRLLVDCDASAAQACYSSGYNNLSHFNRQFLRIVGCTPSAYRKKYAQSCENGRSVNPVSGAGKLSVECTR